MCAWLTTRSSRKGKESLDQLLQQGNMQRKRADSWKHLKVPNTTHLYLNAKQTLSINTSCDSHNYWFIRVSTLLTGINALTVYVQWTAAEEKHFVAENGSRVDIIWKPTKRVPLCSQWITKCFYWYEYYAVNILSYPKTTAHKRPYRPSIQNYWFSVTASFSAPQYCHC